MVILYITKMDRLRELEEENKLLKERLQEKESENKRLKESQRISALGQWDLDIATNNLVWNDIVHEMFEVDKEKFGASYEAFLNAIHPDDRDKVNDAYMKSLHTKEEYKIVHRLAFPDGRIKWVLETCRTEFSGDEPLHSTGTVQDISLLVESELELKRVLAVKDEMLDSRAKFFSQMSHELRTPMHGVLGMISFLKTEGLSERGIEIVNDITANADILLHILDQILDLSRLESGKLVLSHARFNLIDILKKGLSFLTCSADKKGIVMKLNCEEQNSLPTWVNGDSNRVLEILNNLLDNAIKFCKPGSSVTLTLRGLEAVHQGEPNFQLEVSDTGVGISGGAEDWDKIFEVFHSSSSNTSGYKNTGLGLPIVRNLVNLMKGNIRVSDSKLGVGTTFEVNLYLEPCDNEIENTITEVPQLVFSFPSRILIIDDSKLNLKILKRMLQKISPDIDVTEALDGLQGLQYMLQDESTYDPSDLIDNVEDIAFRHYDTPLNFHVCLVDRHMPNMDGIAFIKALRCLEDAQNRQRKSRGLEAFPRVVASIVSASAFSEEVKYCLDNGADYFLAKPFTLSMLNDHLREVQS